MVNNHTPIEDPEDSPQPEPIPADFHTWTQAQVDARGLQLLRELAAHVYTEEEKAAAKHFSRKQESARTVPADPKADADPKTPTTKGRK